MGMQIVKLTDPIQFTNVAGGLVPKGAYNAGTDYAVGDSVDYNGSSYVMHTDAAAGTLPTDTTKWQVLANKGDTGPQGPAGTTDYNELDNLPTLGTAAAKDIPATGNASATEVVYGTDTRLTDSRPASDVSAWAKAPTKPTYTNTEVGAAATVHTHAISDTTGLQTSLDGKVDENAAITGATKTKITYDAKGLVTAGADATTADIADSTNKRYVTDANLTVIGNTSGTNTGDETQATIKTKLGAATASVDGYATSTQITKLDGIEAGAQVNTVTSVNTRTGAVTGLAEASDVATALAGKASITHTHTLQPSGDITGAADTTAINASLIANGHTRLAAGNWYVTNVGLVTNDRWLQGEGEATVINVLPTYTGLTITGPGQIKVSDMAFSGGAYGIYVNGAYDANFSDLYLTGQTAGGIRINGDAATEQHWTNVVMRNVGGVAFDLQRTTSIYTGSLYLDRVRAVEPPITATGGFKFSSSAGSASLNIAFMNQCVADNYYSDACYINNCAQVFVVNSWFAINSAATAGSAALHIVGGFQQSFMGCYTYSGLVSGSVVKVSGAISGITIGGGHVFDGVASSTALSLTGVTTGFNLGSYQNYCGTLTNNVTALSFGGQASSPLTFYTSSTGGSNQNLAIIDTANPTGNTKYIRNSNGALEVVNSAFSAPIMTLNNAGILTVAGLSGSPTAATAATNTNTTQIATTAFVQQELEVAPGIDQVTGEQTIPRYAATADYLAPASGACTFMYFKAHSNALVTQASAVVGNTAVGGATLIRIGLYTVAANGDMTLVASTANDTSLFGGEWTPYSKALSAPYTFVKGQRYAAAVLQVATTPACLYGAAGFVSNAGKTPRICATKTGLANLPSTQTDATLTGNNEKIFWVAFT